METSKFDPVRFVLDIVLFGAFMAIMYVGMVELPVATNKLEKLGFLQLPATKGGLLWVTSISIAAIACFIFDYLLSSMLGVKSIFGTGDSKEPGSEESGSAATEAQSPS